MLDFFEDLEDLGIDHKKLHPIAKILLLTLCRMILACEGWINIEQFGKSKLKFLRTYFPYENEIPSDGTLRGFFRAVDPKTFSEKFRRWVNSLREIGQQLIAIDRKSSRVSYDGDNKLLHFVSAFTSEARLVLAQKKVDKKSNTQRQCATKYSYYSSVCF